MAHEVSVIGAGPVGALWAVFLGRAGYRIKVYERRPDLRRGSGGEGRSINLAISTRGLHALKQIGMEDAILRRAIPMRGRMMHSLKGQLTFQPYGKDETQCIHSLSRAELNKALISTAENSGQSEFHFQYRAIGVDFRAGTVTFKEDDGDRVKVIKPDVVFAADGAGSAIRDEMKRQHSFHCSESVLEYGYKELTLPAGKDGQHLFEKNALHIWPRGTYMLIALPNLDGSFTCTLFLPLKGALSFESLKQPAAVRTFFDKQFPDAAALLPNLASDFAAHPTGHMVTVKCAPWNVDDKFLLIGDAAHGIVPFFGQGMNCGFEDCVILAEHLARHQGEAWPPWGEVFTQFSRARKPDADAIADMALENFVEMRDKVADPRFLLEREVEALLQRAFPDKYRSRYSLVTFSRVPYRAALQAGVIENSLLAELCRGVQRADQVDLAKAQQLIEQKLAPLLKEILPRA